MNITTQLAKLEAAADHLSDLGTQMLRAARELRGEAARLNNLALKEDVVVDRPVVMDKPIAEPAPEPALDIPAADVRSIGRFGEVNIEVARRRAQELGEFTKTQFSARTGLQLAACTRWLTLLVGEQFIQFRTGHYRCLVAPSVRDWVVWHAEDEHTAQSVARMCRMPEDDALRQLEALAKRQVVRENENGCFQYVPVESWQGPKEHHTQAPPERTTRPAYELAQATGMPVRVAATVKATRAQRSTSGAGGIKGAKQRDRRYAEMQAKQTARAEQRRAKSGQGSNGKRAA